MDIKNADIVVVHNGLEPNHILLHLFNDGFEVLLRNFGRAGLESEEPLCPPSNDWSAPEALAAPRNVCNYSN